MYSVNELLQQIRDADTVDHVRVSSIDATNRYRITVKLSGRAPRALRLLLSNGSARLNDISPSDTAAVQFEVTAGEAVADVLVDKDER